MGAQAALQADFFNKELAPQHLGTMQGRRVLLFKLCNPTDLTADYHVYKMSWNATTSNGRGILPDRVNEQAQKEYFKDLMQWTDKRHVLTYFFGAFDEPWKRSADPNEPEKHWGVYKVDRTPKMVMRGKARHHSEEDMK
jgi:hypothetical protein